MKIQRPLPLARLLIAAAVSVTFSGCADLNNPYGNSGSGYYDNNRYDDPYYYERRERERLRDEASDLERERDRLEDERRRLERERQRERNNSYSPPPPATRPPPPQQDRCPSGFSPSEQKCSQEERRRGCKDIRLPSGLGCVRR